MFYYPNVLQRHTGCFSTICCFKVAFLSMCVIVCVCVCVCVCSEDIIDYVKVQVPPIHPSLPRPRFSLYLSCQLQYGVILVYHRQCGFLLEEVQQAIRHLLRSERHSKIDMQEPDRLGLNLPDSLFLLEEAEGALAPFFGKMGDECEMPSHIASPETITIRDKEPVPILTAEFGGAELPEATAYDIDLLMEQQDQFFLGEVEDKERERAGDGETTRELGAAMVSIEQSWTVENPERPLEATKSKARVETTPPPVTLPDTTEASERDLEPEKDTEHCSRKQGRRRQLIFIDQHTQISQDAMREQINNHLIETRSLVCVHLITTCTHMCLCLLDLSINPCALISQSCVLSPTKRRRLQEDSVLSELERERGENRERESSIEVIYLSMYIFSDVCSYQLFTDIYFLLLCGRMLNSHINCFGKVFFSSLVPPEVDRCSAAHVFYKVLELTCERKLSVKQSEPYGPITISRARL
uniref:REC8 meiotic recombination protein b n=1 Tax=Astyanax mexicanus TaxID=7994 RepID=A0A3B1IVS3_ASTMX